MELRKHPSNLILGNYTDYPGSREAGSSFAAFPERYPPEVTK
jgi:hypothetical protein